MTEDISHLIAAQVFEHLNHPAALNIEGHQYAGHEGMSDGSDSFVVLMGPTCATAKSYKITVERID